MARLTSVDTTHLQKPEYYALRAVQSLRKTISTKDLSNDQIILDLSFLVLAEIYARSPYDLQGMPVYWAMIRDCIVQCGGILHIRPRVLRFVLSIDSLLAGIQLSAPALGLQEYPELMGCFPQNSLPQDNNTLLEMISSTMANLDDRSWTLYSAAQRRHEVILALYSLPNNAIHQLRLLIKQHARQFITIFSVTPLAFSNAGGRAPRPSSECARADGLYNTARSNTVNLWYWFSALNLVGADHRGDCGWVMPNAIEMAVGDTWAYIGEIRRLLDGQDWCVSPRIMLWMSVVGLLVAEVEGVCERYKELVLEMARTLSIASLDMLLDAVEGFLPVYTLDCGRLRELRELDW
jgi:hypothetical protein